MQKKLFEDILIRTAKHTPLKLKENKTYEKDKKNNIIKFPKKNLNWREKLKQ